MATNQLSLGLPKWVYVPAALGGLFVALPLAALVLRADLGNFAELFI